MKIRFHTKKVSQTVLFEHASGELSKSIDKIIVVESNRRLTKQLFIQTCTVYWTA